MQQGIASLSGGLPNQEIFDARGEKTPVKKKLTLGELLQDAKSQNREAFHDVREDHALSIIRSIFEALRHKISALDEGRIIIPDFGTFVARSGPVGSEPSKLMRRIRFRISDSKDKGKPQVG